MDEIRPHRHHFRINRGQCNRYRTLWYCDICYYKCSAGKAYLWGLTIYEYDGDKALTQVQVGSKPVIYFN